MTFNRQLAWKLLQDLLFSGDGAQQWVDDIWGLNFSLGEDASLVIEMLKRMVDIMPEAELRQLFRQLQENYLEQIQDLEAEDTWSAIAQDAASERG
jgi:hypothetical protein